MQNKNKKGCGSFRKLPNNSIEYTVSIGNDAYGTRQRKFFYGKTEAECRRKYKEFIKEGEKRVSVSKEHTLSSWLNEWLTTYKSNKVEASTYADYVQIASHIQKHRIGIMKLSQIKPLHITDYFTSKLMCCNNRFCPTIFDHEVYSIVWVVRIKRHIRPAAF